MIGVGGIGSGSFFALRGNHTLGREESRGGRHYVKSLLGPKFRTIPIGQVGDDAVGHRLLNEMKDAGLELDYVRSAAGDQTLFSFCFVYPDGSGGNLTTDDSACAKVDVPFVAGAEPEFARHAGHGVALAAPEAPLEARDKLLKLGTEYGFFRAASFLAEEMNSALEMRMFGKTDLLAINVDEAAAAAGTSLAEASDSVLEIIEAAVEKLRDINPGLLISITAGINGSWSWDGEALVHVPAGLVADLTLPQAQELGTLVAAHSVTSPHTIDKRIDRRSLRAFAEETRAPLSDPVKDLLRD
jgi:sugar/nucleoside kinase (ribokinase family)